MEDSDDNLSFVSASDSDFESDSFLKSLAVISRDSLRPSSPAASLTSLSSFRRRNRKRQAPQPPQPSQPSTKEIATDIVKSPDNNPSCIEPMSTLAQQVFRGVERNSSENTLQQCNVIDGFASHPIHLVVRDDLSSPSTQQILSEVQEAKVSVGNITNLQLRMIDDLLEPLSQGPLVSTGMKSTSPLSPVYQAQGSLSYSPGSSVYSSFASLPQSPGPSPFYVASVQSANLATGYTGYPTVSSSLIDGSIPGSAQYVTVAPLAYVPQMPHQPLSSVMSSSSGFEGSIVTQSSYNPLSHSASDPGIHRLMSSGLLLSPPLATSLERLSEVDEDDDSYEEVFSRDTSSRDLVPLKNGRRGRLERSDSITVAHLYEDIIVSSRWNLKVTFTNLSMVVIVMALFLPNFAAILYNFFRLVFGTLFPAYYSYKAVRTKNVKEYVKWMMYWIVFAFFTCAETITDVFFSFWFPFYYEIKILVVLWLLSPATRGSSILYRKFVHPWLTKKEEEIDECIAKAKQQGYSTVVQLGTKGVNYATSVIMQTAIKGGGGLVNQLKRSYSASEIGEDAADHNRNVKALPQKEAHPSPSEEDDVSVSSGSLESEPRLRAESESYSTRTRGHSTGRAVRTGKTRSADVSEVYFPEVAEPVTQRRSPRTHDAGRTAEGVGHTNTTRRSRSGDISYATLPRATTKRTTVKKRQV